MDIELNKKQNTRGCVKVERWDTTEGLKHYLGVNVICMFESIFSDGEGQETEAWASELKFAVDYTHKLLEKCRHGYLA